MIIIKLIIRSSISVWGNKTTDVCPQGVIKLVKLVYCRSGGASNKHRIIRHDVPAVPNDGSTEGARHPFCTVSRLRYTPKHSFKYMCLTFGWQANRITTETIIRAWGNVILTATLSGRCSPWKLFTVTKLIFPYGISNWYRCNHGNRRSLHLIQVLLLFPVFINDFFFPSTMKIITQRPNICLSCPVIVILPKMNETRFLIFFFNWI